MKGEAIQERFDTLYMERGPCCAGCDWWRSVNYAAGQCAKTAPMSGADRLAMLGISSCTLSPGAGHALTRPTHHCGDFKDEFDWSTLPLGYRARIGDRSLKSARRAALKGGE